MYNNNNNKFTADRWPAWPDTCLLSRGRLAAQSAHHRWSHWPGTCCKKKEFLPFYAATLLFSLPTGNYIKAARKRPGRGFDPAVVSSLLSYLTTGPEGQLN
jgi:hypothetical protein